VESANYTAVTAITANLVPSVNEVYNLGSATLRWRDLYLSGNSLVLGAATISASGSAITLPANSSIGTTSFGSTSLTTEDLTVTGNLTVNGTTTTINSTTLSIDDKNIVLADGAANAAAADGAGITVAGASATLTYASASDSWNVNKNILITPGTANGVLYLNASKVATTGSALTFDGNNLILGGSSGRRLWFVANGTSDTHYVKYDSTIIDGLAINGYSGLSFSTGSTTNGTWAEQMRLTSTGLTTQKDATIYGLTVGRGAGAVSTNTALGASALAGNSTGVGITAIGINTLQNNTASNNTAVGAGVLVNNTSGTRNVAVGSANWGVAEGTMQSNTTGSFNTALGSQALAFNTTASNNTAVGYQALYSNTTGAYNTALGWQAAYNKGAGDALTAVGYQAGYSNTGNSNTFIGAQAGYYVTSGAKNTILGGYNGNQGGLDIRTASNYIVLSDGDGNVRLVGKPTGDLEVTVGASGASTGVYPGIYTSYGAGLSGMAGEASLVNNLYYATGSYRFLATNSGGGGGVSVNYQGVITGRGVGGTGAVAGAATSPANLFSVGPGGTFSLEGGVGSVGGTGITFPATQNASSNANTLDDYEEGTWSPVITDATYNATMAAGTFGRYTKIGRLVTCQIYVETTSLGSLGPGQIYISGWPFSIDRSGGGCFSFGGGLNITANQSVTLRPWSSGLMALSKWNAATGTSAMLSSDWSADGSGFITVSYEV
jgi:hypothetical protein